MKMDTNDIIKGLLKDLISEDEIYHCVQAVVSDRIDRYLRNEIERLVNEAIRDKSDEYIRGSVQKVIDGKVRVDDGWGNHAEYGSFEDLVRARIGKNLNDGWNVERKVREAVDYKIKKLCEEVRKEHVDNMAEQVIDRLAAQCAKEGDNA